MKWNHRVMKIEGPDETIYKFVEAFYDGGTAEPHSTSSVFMYGESIEELKELLARLMRALEKPVLVGAQEDGPEMMVTRNEVPVNEKGE